MNSSKAIKNSYYSGTKRDIAMPEPGEMPPVLAGSPGDWSGSHQEARPKQEDHHDEPDQNNALEAQHENDQEESIDEQVALEVQSQKASSAQENFRMLREARDKAERERDILMQHLLEMQSKQQEPVVVKAEINDDLDSDDFDLSVNDDDLLEGKHAKKLAQELKRMRQHMRQMKNESSQASVEVKIKNQYPDFDEVVNHENVQRLNQEYPDIAASLRDTKDFYSKATSAYKIMKKFGIHQDRSYDQEKALAIKNSQKPRTVTSINPQQGDSPLSKANAFANGLNKDLQAQLLKEMAMARKNL